MSRRPTLLTLTAAGTALLLVGCASPPPPAPAPKPEPTARVVLLPEPGGKPTALTLRTAAGDTVLDQPYAAADVVRGGAVERRQSDAADVQARFGDLLAAQPPRPVSWRVYFVSGREELTPESRPVFEQIQQELRQRPSPEVSVVGHTDRVGKVEANDALSLKRAGFVRDALLAVGVDARQVEAFGRGEREPLVPTADEVPEPRNRRVEISVR
jgi:outer membrane protein OmpA-like peptidoglycan-associated protein